jgi:hypothetical protein
MNAIRVEFEDGFTVITSRYAVRRRSDSLFPLAQVPQLVAENGQLIAQNAVATPEHQRMMRTIG